MRYILILTLLVFINYPAFTIKDSINIKFNEALIKGKFYENTKMKPILIECDSVKVFNIAWVSLFENPRQIRMCTQWVSILDIDEIIQVLYHEHYHVTSTFDPFVDSRLVEESNADLYSFKTVKSLGISKEVCRVDLKIAKVFGIDPKEVGSGNYPTQYQRYENCEKVYDSN